MFAELGRGAERMQNVESQLRRACSERGLNCDAMSEEGARTFR